MTTPTNFSELSLLPQMMNAVTELGFTEATAVQAESIPLIRTGVDILAQSQTGTGKTMAFAIPAVESIDPQDSHVQVLVLSPTRELAQQCGDEVRKLARYLPHVKTADVYGGADFGPQFRALRNANMVIGTPGRVMDHMRRDSLNLEHLKMVILDEADEMLNMGFKEDIETILQDVPEQRQVVLFSATVPQEILAITDQFLKDPVRVNITQGQVTLDNIKQLYVDVPMHQKPEAMKLMMHYFKPRRAIVFANTKSMVDELVELLSAAGFYTQGLHGDMKQLQRTSVMNAFKKGKVNVLVATDVAARGIDVSDIDYVFNFDIPKMSEYYVHRIGRTGRAGRTGTAVTLCCGKRQVIQLQQVGRKTKSTIHSIPLPTVSDIERSNQERDLEQVLKALDKEPSKAHQEMVAKLVELGHSPEAIATALVGLSFQHNLRGLVNLKPVGGGKASFGQERGSKPVRSGERSDRYGDKSPRSGDKAEAGNGVKVRTRPFYADLVINIGSSNRVSPNHILGAIAESTGLRGKSVGQIDISGEHTVVGVPSEHLDTVLESMEGVKICGKPVTVMPLIEPRRRRPAPRSTEGRKGGKPFKKDKKKA